HSRSHEPGDEGHRADDDGFGGEDTAPARAGSEGGADETTAVLGGDEQGRQHDEDDEPGDSADQDAPSRVVAEASDKRGDVAGTADRERVAGLLVPARHRQGGIETVGPDRLTRPRILGEVASDGDLV